MNQPRRPSLSREDQVYAEVAEAVHLSLEAGRPPDVDALAAEHPEWADEIRRLVPLVTTLHQLGHDPDPPPRPAPASRKPTRPLGRIGEYRILREIACGGMGIVYEAQHTITGQRVALKVLPFQQTLDPRHVKRFKIGGYVAKQLNHRNIVPVLEVGRKRGVWYQVMRYIDGPSLAAVIEELRERVGSEVGSARNYSEATRILADALLTARAQPRPAPSTSDTAELSAQPSSPDGMLEHEAYFRTVAHLGLQAAEALEYLHSLDHVHRDVKPANLLWERGRLWLTDFGLVRRPGQNDLTGPGELVGTLRYMSPEQVRGQRDRVSRAADIWGLGVTLYELLTLEPAFPEADPEKLKYHIVFREPCRPRRWNPAIPVDLETVVLKAVAKSPAERYGTAQDLADDLRRFLAGQPVQAKRPTLAQQLLKWAWRHQQGLLVCVAAVMVTLLALAWAGRAQLANRKTFIAGHVDRSSLYLNYYLYRRVFAPEWKKEPREKVLQHLENLLRECQQVPPAEADDHPEWKRAIAVNYLYAAFRYRLLNEDGAARTCCELARDLLAGLHPEPARNPAEVGFLAAAHSELGVVFLRAGRLTEAEGTFRQAQAHLVPLVEHFRALPAADRMTTQNYLQSARYRYELAVCLDHLGSLLKQAKRGPEAELAYGTAIELFEELTREPDAVADYFYDLAGVRNNLGLFLASVGKGEQALAQHRTARDTLQKLAAAHPTRADISSRLGTTLVQAARVQRDKLPEVCPLLEEAARHHQTAFRLQPQEGEYRAYLSGTLIELASTQVRLRRHEAAAATAQQIAEQFHDDWQERVRSLAVLAYCVELAEKDRLLADGARRAQVEEYTLLVRGHLRTLTEQGTADPAIQNEVAWFLATCPAPRLRSPAEAVALAKQAVGRDGARAEYWHTLGVASYRAENWTAARQALENAARRRDGGSASDWLFLAMTHARLGERGRAEEYLARAARWLEEHKPNKVELQRFWQEAAAAVRSAPAPAP